LATETGGENFYFQITTPFFSPLIGFSPLIKGENFQIWELASK